MGSIVSTTQKHDKSKQKQRQKDSTTTFHVKLINNEEIAVLLATINPKNFDDDENNDEVKYITEDIIVQVDPDGLTMMDSDTYDQIFKFEYKKILSWGNMNETDFVFVVYMNSNNTMTMKLRIKDENSLMMSILDKTFDEKSFGDLPEEKDNDNSKNDNNDNNDDGKNSVTSEKSLKQKQKEAENKLLEVSSPLMQTLILKEIRIFDIFDAGNMFDKQDPGLTIYIGNQLFKTERLKEAGTEGQFPEVFNDIQIVAKEISNGLKIIVEVDNLNAFGLVKNKLGKGEVQIRDHFSIKGTEIEFTIQLMHDGVEKGQVIMKGELGTMHRLHGYPNIHLFNRMIESKNRYYLSGDHIKVSKFTILLRSFMDQLDLR